MKSLEHRIKTKATELGIVHLGITSVDKPKHFEHFVQWAEKGYAGDMWYLTETSRKEKRGKINEVFPEAKSVMLAAFSYKPEKDEHKTNAKFARYGWGMDYHKFVKQKLQTLMDWTEAELGKKFQYRIYVDTGPILEKSLAERAGVGWIGKNTCLINQKYGSYLFLGEVLMDLELPSDKPATFHCGTCTKCLDACPTNAFVAPFQMDATKCISYHTIESKNLEMPDEISKNLSGYVAGCDICQEVCPWNNKAPATTLSELTPGTHTSLTLDKILTLTQKEYDSHFAQTSFKRIPLAKLKANAKYNSK
jgi:epoxyqueuosine reductase